MRYGESVLGISVFRTQYFFAAIYILGLTHTETHVRLYTVIVISVRFSLKPGRVEKLVKYREIPLR
jgi:hypothetical protein